jgi:hypothetical protein
MKLLSYQPVTGKDKENSQPSNTPPTSVTNNITNKDNATFDQSINLSIAQPASNTPESSQLEQASHNNEKERPLFFITTWSPPSTSKMKQIELLVMISTSVKHSKPIKFKWQRK